MKFFSLILILILSISAFADCRVPNENSFVVVGEGQTISLLSEGKSLANHKIQDQDGMGTCYANTTSTMLKTVLPGNPELSYLHMAVQSASNGVRDNFDAKNPKYWRMGQENKMESFADGGFICETISALKKTGGACRQDQSLLEIDQMDSNIQEKAFKNLGIYFDALNKAKANPADFEKFKTDVTLAVEAINNEKNNIRLKCEEEKKSTLPLDGAFSKFLSYMYFNINDDSFCGKLRLEGFKKLASKDSLFEKDRTRIKPEPEMVAKLRAAIMADAGLKKMMLDRAAGQKIPRLLEINMAKVLGKKMLDLFDSVVPKKETLPVCSDHQDTSVVNDLVSGDQFFRDMVESKKSTCPVENDAVLADVFSHNSCIAPTNLEMILSAFSPLLSIGKDLNQNMNHLLNQNPTSAGQIKNLLMPGCYKPENIIPVGNINCSTYTPCDSSNLTKIDNTYSTASGGGCTDITTAVTEARKKIFNGLNSNRALGVSVCTSFMVNPSQKTDFCKNKGQGVDKHTFHAMTVGGLRCANGKMEYQLVNSWGKYNCPKGAMTSGSPLKCEKDKDGNDTGRFWVPEDIMVDSMTGLTDITNGGQ